MPDQQTSPSGTTQTSGGSDGPDSQVVKPQTPEPQAAAPSTKDVVAYETHRQLLSEKKKLQEWKIARETEDKDKEAKTLQEQDKWKEFAQLKEKEAADSSLKLSTLQTDIDDAKKLSSFIQAIPGTVDPKFWPILKEQFVSKLAVNPETNEVDPVSVKQCVDEFVNTFPELLSGKPGPSLPNDVPRGGSTTLITAESYKKLSLKEMKEKAGEYTQQKLKEISS